MSVSRSAGPSARASTGLGGKARAKRGNVLEALGARHEGADVPDRAPKVMAGSEQQKGAGSVLPDDGAAGLDLRHDALGYALKQAQVRSYEILFDILGPDALSPARMTALSIIATHVGISQSALADLLRVNRASVVKVIDTLEALQLVERRQVAGDRRSHSLVATAAGKDELQRLRLKTERYEQAIAAGLTADERRQLMCLLGKVAPRPA